jgi:type II secretory pathway component PulF
VSEAWRYRAATGTGALVDGVVQAASVTEAANELRRQSLVPVSVESATRAAPSSATRALGFSGYRRHESMAAAMRTLATLQSAGLALEPSLDFVRRHATHAGTAAIFDALRLDVQRGVMLSEAMRQQPALGGFSAAVVHAGEESGTLDQALVRLADWHEEANALRAEVRASLMYPALMGTVAGIGVAILLAFVVPRFVSILGDVGGTLPLSTRLLVAASGVVTGWWWIWLPLMAVTVLLVRRWAADAANRQRWHAARLELPWIGPLERSAMASRYISALGVLLHSGSPMLRSMRVAREGVTNLSMAAALDAAAERVARGDRVAESLTGTLPSLAVELLGAGEEGGRLPETCERAARMLEESTGRSLRTLVRLVEPALILAFGGIVGFIALAMLQAVYSVNASAL